MQSTWTKTSAEVVTGATFSFALMLLAGPTAAVAAPPAACATPPEAAQHYQIPANAETVHWTAIARLCWCLFKASQERTT